MGFGSYGDQQSKVFATCSVFFYIGNRFCIRGGKEQRRLCLSQFVRSGDSEHYTYVEHGSKNNCGSLAKLRSENKCVPCYPIPEESPRCLVFLLDQHLNKLPQYAFDNYVLYCWPKPCTPASSTVPWYENAPVRKNKLASMVKDMCVEAGIAVKTNHSLWATGAPK